ncbi:hypothetical protein ACJX0J_027383 [Zea mays]
MAATALKSCEGAITKMQEQEMIESERVESLAYSGNSADENLKEAEENSLYKFRGNNKQHSHVDKTEDLWWPEHDDCANEMKDAEIRSSAWNQIHHGASNQYSRFDVRDAYVVHVFLHFDKIQLVTDTFSSGVLSDEIMQARDKRQKILFYTFYPNPNLEKVHIENQCHNLYYTNIELNNDDGDDNDGNDDDPNSDV